MRRIAPPKTIDTIGAVGLQPERAAADYVESKLQDKYGINPPNASSAGETIELMHIRNARERVAMGRLQHEMLTNAKQQKEANELRIRKLQKVQAYLRRRFIDVNVFMKDCVEKRDFAEKRVGVETEKHQQFHMNIAQSTQSIEELTQFREVLKKTVTELEPYEVVLVKAAEKSELFVSVKDCLDRCDALMLAQQEIQEMQQMKIFEIAEMRKRMLQTTSEAKLKIMGMQTALVELERTYTEAQNKCFKWEKILQTTNRLLDAQFSDKCRVLSGIFHLFRLLYHRRKIVISSSKDLTRANASQVLDYIREEVSLLNDVLEACKTEDLTKKKKKRSIRSTVHRITIK